MKFKIIDKKISIIYLNNAYKEINENNSKEIIKEIILLIKKRYSYNIYGFYEVNIYKVKKISTIIIFKKRDNDELFYNTIDLKIIHHKKTIDIFVDDFSLSNNNEIYKICEHYSVDEVNLHR